MVLLVLFATSRTNIDHLQVLFTMSPIKDRVYARGRPKSSTPYGVARAARATPKKVASGVVTASSSDEERTLTGTPSGSATNEEGASGSLGVSWSVEASGYGEVPAPATAAASASSDEADSSESTPDSPAHDLTPATDQPNWFYVDARFQVFSDAKFPTHKGVMIQTLTSERRLLKGSLPMIPKIHNLFTRHRLEWTARPVGRYSEEMV